VEFFLQSFFGLYIDMSVKSGTESWDKGASLISSQTPQTSTTYGIPDEAEDKIQYAFRMILEAHRGRSMTNENEIRSLRQTIEELKVANANLTKKYAAAEREIMEQQHRNQVLSKDNDNLAMANRQLLQRCEKYKRIQQTFSEALENSGHEEDLPPMPTISSEYRPTTASFTTNSGPPMGHLSPKTTTVSAPIERNNSNGSSSGGGLVPQSVASAPPPSSSFDSNGKDGKQFFRIVRTRLPFESFTNFLNIIKKLNAHEHTRESALEEAKKIFGSENQDLLGDFQSLISRHTSAAA
jgi:hypothetical protein